MISVKEDRPISALDGDDVIGSVNEELALWHEGWVMTY